VPHEQFGPLKIKLAWPVPSEPVIKLLYWSTYLTLIWKVVPAVWLVGVPVFPFPLSKVSPGKVIIYFVGSVVFGTIVILSTADVKPVAEAVIVHVPAV